MPTDEMLNMELTLTRKTVVALLTAGVIGVIGWSGYAASAELAPPDTHDSSVDSESSEQASDPHNNSEAEGSSVDDGSADDEPYEPLYEQQEDVPEIDESDPSLGPIYMVTRPVSITEDLPSAVSEAAAVIEGRVIGVEPGEVNDFFEYVDVHIEVSRSSNPQVPVGQTVRISQFARDHRTGRPLIVEGQVDLSPGDETMVLARSINRAQRGAPWLLEVESDYAVFEITDGRINPRPNALGFAVDVQDREIADVRAEIDDLPRG